MREQDTLYLDKISQVQKESNLFNKQVDEGYKKKLDDKYILRRELKKKLQIKEISQEEYVKVLDDIDEIRDIIEQKKTKFKESLGGSILPKSSFLDLKSLKD